MVSEIKVENWGTLNLMRIENIKDEKSIILACFSFDWQLNTKKVQVSPNANNSNFFYGLV